jgi:hypothetical protein
MQEHCDMSEYSKESGLYDGGKYFPPSYKPKK